MHLANSRCTVPFIQALFFMWGEELLSFLTQITGETQAHHLPSWHLTLLLTQKKHGKSSVTSGTLFVGENKTRWTTWGIEGGMGKCSHRSSKCKFSSKIQSVFVIMVRSNEKIYLICLGSGFLKQSLAWELGSVVDVTYVYLQCSKRTLS